MVQEKKGTPSDDAAAGTSPVDVTRIEAYLQGKSATFRELDGWIRSVLLRAYPRLAGEIDDLCQTVHGSLFVQLRAGNFQGRSGLRSYVGGIAHHTALRRLRRVYRERELLETLTEEPSGSVESPYGAIESRDEVRETYRVLAALPQSCRELWKLIYLDKLNYEEVSERLSVPVGTVKSRMWYCRHRARKALRRHRLSTSLSLSPRREIDP